MICYPGATSPPLGTAIGGQGTTIAIRRNVPVTTVSASRHQSLPSAATLPRHELHTTQHGKRSANSIFKFALDQGKASTCYTTIALEGQRREALGGGVPETDVIARTSMGSLALPPQRPEAKARSRAYCGFSVVCRRCTSCATSRSNAVLPLELTGESPLLEAAPVRRRPRRSLTGPCFGMADSHSGKRSAAARLGSVAVRVQSVDAAEREAAVTSTVPGDSDESSPAAGKPVGGTARDGSSDSVGPAILKQRELIVALGVDDGTAKAQKPPLFRGLTEDEFTRRGVRDTLCFTLVLVLAGGPSGLGHLTVQSLTGLAVALRQAHTHPQIIFFTSSLVPFLAFVYELWRCGRETRGVCLAFASLLVFVVAGIPLESYTESEFGELVSNVDSVHFGVQSLVSSTNLAIILALQDATLNAAASASPSGGRQVGLRADTELLSALVVTSVAGASALKHAGSQLVLHPSPGATVGDSDLYPFLCVLFPTLMGAGWLLLASRLPDDSERVATDNTRTESGPIEDDLLQLSLWSGASILALATILAPWGGSEYIPEPANALSVPTWSVHVFSLLEWSVAMALVWQYSQVARQPAWKGLAWGMIPLHGSGLCAVVFHLWYNSPDLDWLISLQAFLTLLGNTTCWYATRRIRKTITSTST